MRSATAHASIDLWRFENDADSTLDLIIPSEITDARRTGSPGEGLSD